MESQKIKNGIIITVIAGVLWGFSGTCAQYLFETYGMSPVYLTAMRMLLSGAVLSAVSLIRYRERFVSMLTKKEALLRLLVFSLGGVMFNQVTYLLTISYTNSGTATILQYIGPVLVMVTSCFIEKRMPQGRELTAIALVVIGTFLLATHGDIRSLCITPKGLIWGLISAFALMSYTMLPGNLLKEYGAIPVVGGGMLFGGMVLFLGSGSFRVPFNGDSGFLVPFFVIIIFGTVLPYTMYLMGVNLCGAVKASMIASVEPVSATVCMVVWLGESFSVIDFIGFACIFATVFLLAGRSAARFKQPR